MILRCTKAKWICLCLTLTLFLSFCACSPVSGTTTVPSASIPALIVPSAAPPSDTPAGDHALQTRHFVEIDAYHVLSPDGIEYTCLINSGFLTCFGELTFEGCMEGEEGLHPYGDVDGKRSVGFYSIKDADTDNILIRVTTGEWDDIYRRTDLPPFDYSLDNCVRLELILLKNSYDDDSGPIDHSACGDGITDREEIAAFLADVRAQGNPEEADFYDLSRDENGYVSAELLGIVFAFFAEEPELAVPMWVYSFHDLGYSIRLGRNQNGLPDVHVLPPEWIPRLLAPGESFP